MNPELELRTQSSWLGFSQGVLVFGLFILIVLGAAVRLGDAGLACPDWPLCFGEFIPEFDLKVFLEWFHRFIAGSLGLLSLGIALSVLIHPQRRSRFGLFVLGSLILFAVQAWLGMQTVIQLLRAEVVTAHLVGGYAVFALNLWLYLKFVKPRQSAPNVKMPRSVTALCLAFLGLVFVQATLGALVSSHYAGLACPDFPTCHGEWFPGLSGKVGLHFVHRLGAFIVLGLSLYLGLRSPRPLRGVYRGVLILVLVQIVLGLSMIFSLLPWELSLIHSLNSISIFSLAVIGCFRVVSSNQ